MLCVSWAGGFHYNKTYVMLCYVMLCYVMLTFDNLLMKDIINVKKLFVIVTHL